MMMEFILDRNLPLEEVKSKIKMIFEILKFEDISSEDYQMILFLLSAYKDGLFSNVIIERNEFIKESIIEQLHCCNSKLFNTYTPIIDSFEPSILRLSENGLRNIFNLLIGINNKDLSDNFPDIFDSILYQISQSQGRCAGEYIQPIELTRFMCALADLKTDAKVFNPFAGLASFGVYLDKGVNYYGQEINQKTWALGVLRQMAYGRSGTSKYECDDSILHWPSQSETFDLIISTPPFAMRIGSQYRSKKSDFRTIEPFLIDKAVHSLKKNGKLIALLPVDFLFRGFQERRVIESIVEEDLLETIISLPGGLLLNTGIPIVILVISKTKELKGKVKFVDAKNFLVTKDLREKVLNDEALINFVKGESQDENVLKIVDNLQIRENEYNLYIPKYFRKKFYLHDVEAFVELKSVLKEVKYKRANLPKIGKLVKISDLKDDRIDYILDLSTIKATELTQSNINQISESCLLLSSNLKPLKPTIFEYQGEPIYVQGIQCFKIKESIVDKSYLINELHNDYVKEQIVTFNMGSTMYFSDIMEVTIKFPSLEEQRAKVNGIVELTDEIRILQNKLNSNILGESNSIYEKISLLKHRLGTPLLNIGSSLRNVEKALSREFISWEEIKLNERYTITLRESFDSIHKTLETVHKILIVNEKEIDFSNKELKEIDFFAFIKDYFNSIKSAERTNVSTILDIHPDIESQLKNKVSIIANSELLEIGLNTIVDNAYKHAFIDNSKKYKLVFTISLSLDPYIKRHVNDTSGRFDSYIKIEVANNGKRFSKNYSLEKLIRKNSFAGITGNTGQGGYDLNEIIKFHNNGISTLDLITDNYTSEFTTTYSFLIPLN